MTTELIQFIGALVLFAGILVGSYWFVYAPTRRAQEQDPRRDAEEE